MTKPIGSSDFMSKSPFFTAEALKGPVVPEDFLLQMVHRAAVWDQQGADSESKQTTHQIGY